MSNPLVELRDEAGHLLARVGGADVVAEVKCRKCKLLYRFRVQQFRVTETSKQIVNSLQG